MKRNRLINVLAIGLSVVILLAIGMPFVLRTDRDALDGRTEIDALTEMYNYLELANAPTDGVRVLGYRAGWNERFLKIQLSRSDLSSLLSQVHCTNTLALPDYIDGMDPSETHSWWNPRDMAPTIIVECTLTRRVGKGAVIVHDIGEGEVTV